MAAITTKTAITTKIIKFLFVFIMVLLFVQEIAPTIASAIPVYTGPGTSEKIEPNQRQDIMARIAQQYQEKTQRWGDVLMRYASIMFGAFLTIDIILFAVKNGIKMASGGEINLGGVIGELFLTVILPAAFMWTVLQYHQEWSQSIVRGFLHIAKEAEPTLAAQSGSFFLAGLHIFSVVMNSVEVLSPSTWFLVLAGLIILLCYVMMALQVLLVQCEGCIVLSAGVIILGFGSFSMTRQYATNFFRYVLSVSIKLFVIQLMIGLGFSFVEDFMKTTTAHTDIGTVIGGSIVLLGLIRCIPDICAGIISGQHVSTGNALAGAISTVGAGAMALAQNGVAAATGLPSALKNAGSAAMESGGGSAVRSAGSFLKNLAGAATDAAGITGEGAAKSGLGRFNSKLQTRALRGKGDGNDGNG